MSSERQTSVSSFISIRRIIVAVVCIGMVVAGYFQTRPSDVSLRLASRLQQLHAPVIFSEVAPFVWDRVYIFPPYTSPQAVQNELGFEWRPLLGTTIESSDGVCLVVFVKDNAVVHWFEHPRNQGDLDSLGRHGGFSREDAQFEWKPQPQREFSRLVPAAVLHPPDIRVRDGS